MANLDPPSNLRFPKPPGITKSEYKECLIHTFSKRAFLQRTAPPPPSVKASVKVWSDFAERFANKRITSEAFRKKCGKTQKSRYSKKRKKEGGYIAGKIGGKFKPSDGTKKRKLASAPTGGLRDLYGYNGDDDLPPDLANKIFKKMFPYLASQDPSNQSRDTQLSVSGGSGKQAEVKKKKSIFNSPGKSPDSKMGTPSSLVAGSSGMGVPINTAQMRRRAAVAAPVQSTPARPSQAAPLIFSPIQDGSGNPVDASNNAIDNRVNAIENKVINAVAPNPEHFQPSDTTPLSEFIIKKIGADDLLAQARFAEYYVTGQYTFKAITAGGAVKYRERTVKGSGPTKIPWTMFTEDDRELMYQQMTEDIVKYQEAYDNEAKKHDDLTNKAGVRTAQEKKLLKQYTKNQRMYEMLQVFYKTLQEEIGDAASNPIDPKLQKFGLDIAAFKKDRKVDSRVLYEFTLPARSQTKSRNEDRLSSPGKAALIHEYEKSIARPQKGKEKEEKKKVADPSNPSAASADNFDQPNLPPQVVDDDDDDDDDDKKGQGQGQGQAQGGGGQPAQPAQAAAAAAQAPQAGAPPPQAAPPQGPAAAAQQVAAGGALDPNAQIGGDDYNESLDAARARAQGQGRLWTLREEGQLRPRYLNTLQDAKQFRRMLEPRFVDAENRLDARFDYVAEGSGEQWISTELGENPIHNNNKVEEYIRYGGKLYLHIQDFDPTGTNHTISQGAVGTTRKPTPDLRFKRNLGGGDPPLISRNLGTAELQPNLQVGPLNPTKIIKPHIEMNRPYRTYVVDELNTSTRQPRQVIQNPRLRKMSHNQLRRAFLS